MSMILLYNYQITKISIRIIANFWPNEIKRCSLSVPQNFEWEKVSSQFVTESLQRKGKLEEK